MKAPERVPSRAPTPKPLPLGYGEARLTIGPGRIRDKFSSKPFVPELQTTFRPPPRQSMPWPKPARAGRSHLSRSSRAIAESNVTVRKTNVALRPLRERGWDAIRQHHHAARARRCESPFGTMSRTIKRQNQIRPLGFSNPANRPRRSIDQQIFHPLRNECHGQNSKFEVGR